MGNKAWKQHERSTARALGGQRYWANSGEAVDVEGPWYIAQCKHVRVLAFPALERLALEAQRQGIQRGKIGLVVVKRRGGHGVQTPTLVVLTIGQFREMGGPLPYISTGGAVIAPPPDVDPTGGAGVTGGGPSHGGEGGPTSP